MKTKIVMTTIVVGGWLLPEIALAQTSGGDIQNLQSVLDSLYEEMVPLCSEMIDVGRGLSGFAAMWYIASRIWRHIANAEQVDFYPLLRPFVIGFCILIFPSVLALVNSILKPTVTGTASMITGSNASIAELLKRKDE